MVRSANHRPPQTSRLIITYHTTCRHNTYDRERCQKASSISPTSSSSSSAFCKSWPLRGWTDIKPSSCARCEQWARLAKVSDMAIKEARARRLSFQWQQQYPAGLLAIPPRLRPRAMTGDGDDSLRHAWTDSRSRAASDPALVF